MYFQYKQKKIIKSYYYFPQLSAVSPRATLGLQTPCWRPLTRTKWKMSPFPFLVFWQKMSRRKNISSAKVSRSHHNQKPVPLCHKSSETLDRIFNTLLISCVWTTTVQCPRPWLNLSLVVDAVAEVIGGLLSAPLEIHLWRGFWWVFWLNKIKK